ncbi:putative reverse transcriptase domain-containing protein [Tanacetum coccineum]
MMRSTWLVNWSSKQFRVELQELVKATKENRKTTKETPTTITPTTTTTTATKTAISTISTNSRIGGRKLLRLMLQPKSRVRAMLGIYLGAIGARHIISRVLVLQSMVNVIGLVIRRRIVEPGCVEKSFVSTPFTPYIDIAPVAVGTSYEVELADGKVVSTNTILRGCTLTLFNHVFKIDLLPTRLGSFDVIVGMDWLSYHHSVIVCYEKIVRIPLLNGEILGIQGERLEKDPKLLSCIQADKKKPEYIRVVCDFLEVFQMTCQDYLLFMR